MPGKPSFSTSKTSLNQGQILGINVTSTHKQEVLRLFDTKIARQEKFYVVTPNPEIVLQAQNDLILKKILNSADLSLPDGIALLQAAKFLALPLPQSKLARAIVLPIQGLMVGLATFVDRTWLTSELTLIKGRQMFLELVGLANQKGWRVYLYGGEKGETEETKKILQRKMKRLKIKAGNGPLFDQTGNPKTSEGRLQEERAVKEINAFNPHILFVAATPPKQEKWLGRWFAKLNIGAAMVVGGTYNFVAGHSKLPPKWMESVGLEWLWRLMTEPERAHRIFNAVIVFPLRVFWYKFTIDTPEPL